MNKTYLDLLNEFIILNKKYDNFLSNENIFEFIYDDVVYNKTIFAMNSNNFSKNNKIKLDKFLCCIRNKIPWERVLKYSYFYNNKIILFDNVFSPRYDTEFLVNEVINDSKNFNKDLKIYDFGSGTGCMNVAISNKLKNVQFTNFELSVDACKNTQENIKYHNIANSRVININYIDWLEKNDIDANIIVCNPPYINKNFPLEKSVADYDPELALFSNDGCWYHKKIIEIILKKALTEDLTIYFEIGYDQKELLEKFLLSKNIKNYTFVKDLNNVNRILKINFLLHRN